MAQATKQDTYVFNRETGEPIWPINEIAMPASTVPGEQLTATQPIPANLRLLSREFEPVLADYTPEIKQQASLPLPTTSWVPFSIRRSSGIIPRGNRRADVPLRRSE